MLNNRDFTASNKQYFSKNKFPILILCLVLVLGVVCGLVFGVRGNFEISGYNEFSVLAENIKTTELNKYQKDIETIVNKNGGDVFSISVGGEGNFSKFIVKYSATLKSATQTEINKEIAQKLGIEESEIANYISNHNFVAPVVRGRDYIFTAVAILIIVVLATIFAYFRYDGACAVSTILAALIGSLLFISFSTILRLTIGMSYFAMLVLVNLLIVYCSFLIFENIRETNWLQSKEYSAALSNALKDTRTRVLFITCAVAAIGLIFAFVAPNNLKFVAINLMFVAVTLLAIVWYVVPFCWSALITRTNIKRFKVKTKTQDKPND